MTAIATRNSELYAGSTSDGRGRILRSLDGQLWEVFQQTDEAQVLSLFVWANALFAGTESNGKMYVNNFTTGKFYCIMQSPDHAITCMAEYNGKLYAGTSPGGFVYTFDGTKWELVYQAYGHGINSMVSTGEQLFVFANNVESPIAYNGTVWSLMDVASVTSASQQPTVASLRNVSTPVFSPDTFEDIDVTTIMDVDLAVEEGKLSEQDRLAVIPPRPDFGFSKSAVDGSNVLFGSADYATVYKYSGQVARYFGTDGDGVSAIANIRMGKNMVAFGDKVYLLTE